MKLFQLLTLLSLVLVMDTNAQVCTEFEIIFGFTVEENEFANY